MISAFRFLFEFWIDSEPFQLIANRKRQDRQRTPSRGASKSFKNSWASVTPITTTSRSRRLLLPSIIRSCLRRRTLAASTESSRWMTRLRTERTTQFKTNTATKRSPRTSTRKCSLPSWPHRRRSDGASPSTTSLVATIAPACASAPSTTLVTCERMGLRAEPLKWSSTPQYLEIVIWLLTGNGFEWVGTNM